jgi:hypothetical protein
LVRRNIWHAFAEELALIRHRRGNTRRRDRQNYARSADPANDEPLQHSLAGHMSSSLLLLRLAFPTASVYPPYLGSVLQTVTDQGVVRYLLGSQIPVLKRKGFPIRRVSPVKPAKNNVSRR